MENTVFRAYCKSIAFCYQKLFTFSSITQNIFCVNSFACKITENFLFQFITDSPSIMEDFMANLEKIFAEKVFANIDKARISKGLDAIDIVNQLIDMGVFGDNHGCNNEEIKNNKRNLYNDWKSGKSKSYMKFIEEIADILSTSIEELSDVTVIKNNGNVLHNSINDSDNAVLLIANDTDNSLSSQEWEIIRYYRSLNIKKQVELVQFILQLQEDNK